MILATKCAPQESLLTKVQRAGIEAVELYLSDGHLRDVQTMIRLCKNFPLRYAVHAPNEGFAMEKLAEFSQGINAQVIVFHNVYWEDEWAQIIKQFKRISAPLCVENTYSIHEPVKFMRRYGIGRCLDLEHLQMEACGVYEETFISVIKEASHIHLSGYYYGSPLWHTHIHHSPEHSLYMLNLVGKAGYKGFIVSEAKVALQTYEEFKKLNDFFRSWKSAKNKIKKG